MKKILSLLIVPALLFACKKEDHKKNTYEGPAVQVRDGKAKTIVTLSKDGAPEQLIISINNAALNSLPIGGDGSHNHENNYVLPFPEKAKAAIPFKFVGMNWNPAGHEPANIYGLPHFDFHYYMVTEAEVANTTDMEKMEIHPDVAYLPQTYFAGPAIPQMGKHWLDPASPELSQTNPAVFTQTFIFGSYNGNVTFWEPMITLEFIKNSTNFERSIPQPAKFKQAGYYPTKLRIKKQQDGSQIILDDFVYRQAS